MGLIDRHGVPQEFIQTEAEMLALRRRLLRKGKEFALRIMENTSDLNEAIIIQKMLTGEDLDGNEAVITNAEWSSLTDEIRQSLDELGMEAVALGLISRESYERNKGTYLHRVYIEHELGTDKNISRYIGRLMAGRKHAIAGEQLKGRGLFTEVTQARLLRDISTPDVKQFFGIKKRPGKPDESLMTKKFRILQLFDEGPAPGTQPLEGMEEGSYPKKVKKRVIMPADQPIPARLANYE
ncbi:MAG: hypothetical protein GTO41_27035, partial [Burkholderiales bacterium]|nr:hypothetical protein [Burkholderiales bacterium]